MDSYKCFKLFVNNNKFFSQLRWKKNMPLRHRNTEKYTLNSVSSVPQRRILFAESKTLCVGG